VYEVLVVDNNSTDGTKETVMSYIPQFGSPELKNKCLGLKYLFEPRQGKSYALNCGIQEVKGDIVAFTDDDVLVDPRWLFHLMECFEKYNCDGLGGRVVPVYPDKTPRWIRDNPTKLAGVVVVADYGQETKPYGKPMDPFIGSNYAFKREVFDACGVFRLDLGPGTKTMGEDTEFIHRLVQQGKSLYYCGAALVRHPVDLSRLRLKYVIKWHMALGRFAAMNEIPLLDSRKTVYYFGIPRYLFRGILRDALFLVPSMVNPMSFYDCLRGLFRKAGMISEYWKENGPRNRDRVLG
jgi:glycosyltransferase involved in cell wall biosynthesis